MKKFLYIFICVFVLSVLLCFSVSAATATTNTTEDGVVWNATIDETKGTAEITGATIEIRTDRFDIPKVIVYNDIEYPVTSIKANAFKDKTLAFGKVTFPDTLELIGDYAFYKTNIYSDIVLPESVVSVGKYAFAECKGILTMTLPSSMLKIPEGMLKNCLSLTSVYTSGVIKEVGAEAFNTCYALHDIQIGNGTTKIGSKSFYECRGLDGTLDLSTITSIATDSFQGCFNLTGVKLSAYKFDLGVFSGCREFESYEVVPESTHYSTLDGVLYNSDKTVLYRYPVEKKDEVFTVPSTVVEIATDAFYGAYHLGKITLNQNLTKIGANAFRGSGVEYMYIPDKVSTIGSYALADCENLEWVVISKKASGATYLVSNSVNVKLVIARNSSFNKSVGITGICRLASEYTCTDHIYGFLDDTASCTESGINTCIICDRSSYVKPTGHEGAIVERSTLDCTTDYYVIVNCTKCGDPRAKTIYEKATGHVSTPKTVKPTATTPGFTVETCSVCNQTILSNYIATFYTVGDLNNDGKIDNTDATLLASYIGGKTFDVNRLSCDVNCDGNVDIYDLIALRRNIAKLPDAEITNNEDGCKKHLHVSSFNASTVSCVDDGIEIEFCLDCGVAINTTTINKTGHNWQINSKIEATCSNSGFSSVNCTVCKISTIIMYEQLDHSRNWWTMPGKKGYEYSECTVCGTFESRAVDYSEFDILIDQIPEHYETYYSSATLALLKPILDNYKLALTQEQVNQNIQEFKNLMPRIQYAVTDVPVIYINSLDKIKLQDCNQGNTPKLNAEIIVAYYDENGVYHDYIDTNGEAKVRGNSTANPAKKPYNIYFSTDVDLFGMGKDNKYCLLANAIEPALMRNALVRLFNDTCGLDYACQYEFVDVYADGSYRGSYLMSTPVDIEETRVDIDKETDAILEIEQSFAEGDFYIERSKHSPFFNLRFQIANGNDLNGEGYSRVFSTICQLEYAIISGDYEEVQKFADIESLAKYYVLAEYFKDVDFNWDSTRFYIEDGKLHGGPAWDYDRSAGHAAVTNYRDRYNNMTSTSNGNRCDSTTGEYANSIGIGKPSENWINTLSNSDWIGGRDNHTWFTYLYHYSPEFMDLVSNYVFELKDEMTLMYADVTDDLGAVTKNAIDEIYYDDNIYASFARNNTIWNIPASTGEGWTFNSMNEAVAHLRTWLADRHEWMINYYAGDQLANYCAERADVIMLDPNYNAYAKDTSTSLTTDANGHYTYTVNVKITRMALVGNIEESLYNKVKDIFASNLSYATVAINLVYEGAIVSSYSDNDVLNATMQKVIEDLGNSSSNKYADSTTVEFIVENGTVKANVKVVVAGTSGANDNQKIINDLVKKHFNEANFYVYVDVAYYTSATATNPSAHYANGTNYNG